LAPAMLLFLAVAVAPSGASAKNPPSLHGPVATVGDRTIEAVDIEQAARALSGDPTAAASARAWRRSLLDHCVDRELLSAEAVRRGWLDSASVKQRVEDLEYTTLSREAYEKVLVPGIIPTPDEFEEIKREGLYRYVDLLYILVRDDQTQRHKSQAERIAARARAGGAWDSLTKMYSDHPPSASAKGHLGVVMVQELEPIMYDSFRTAKPGDVLGPFTGPYGHDILKVIRWVDIPDDSLRALVIDDRTRKLHLNNISRLLKKYHFTPDSSSALGAMAAFGSEDPDSILASLGPDGTRPARGIRPALGVVARVDSGTVTVADIIRYGRPTRNQRGRVIVRDARHLATLAGFAVQKRLAVRDAREHGLHEDPRVARTLRLQREEAATLAMVRHARPADPTPAALKNYIEQRSARYRWPAGVRASVLMFADADSARNALRAWNGVGLPPDSVLAAKGFRTRTISNPDRLFAKQRAELVLRENGVDPLSKSVRGLSAGQFAPVIATPHGWAVAYVSGPAEARPMTEEEAAPRALRDWREEAENQWVTDLLVRLRAKTPVKVIPARLDAVRLTAATPSGKGSK
jgi:hypothetical protein